VSAPAGMDLKQDAGAGHGAGDYRPGPRIFPPSPNVLKLSGERSGAERVRCSAVFGGLVNLHTVDHGVDRNIDVQFVEAEDLRITNAYC
jgi:hypothetical protein